MDSGRLEAAPGGTGHLDTVRALHQTVVSLRTALEVSKNELKELKQKYQQHSNCIQYTDVIEKLSLENHILRRKIIDSGFEDREVKTPNIKLQVTYSPRQDVEEYSASEVVIKSATTDVNSNLETVEPDLDEAKETIEEDSKEGEELAEQEDNFCSTDHLNNIEEQPKSPEVNITAEFSPNNVSTQRTEVEDPNSQVISISNKEENHPASFKTKLELLSKFDVRIKVRTIKEGTVVSSTTSDSESVDNKETNKVDKESTESNTSFYFGEKREHLDTTEDGRGNKVNFKTVSEESVKMAVPNEAEAKTKVDKFDVQVRITSEENLVVKEQHAERTRRKDTLNLDVDDLSLRSLSEGDNSVFSESVTPVEPRGPAMEEHDQAAGSGNESEEVDDIELIFTTDESKDMSNLQEDLVSIREGDHWGPSSASTHSTPVLIKFHTLDPDFQPGETAENRHDNQENIGIPGAVSDMKKRGSLPNDCDVNLRGEFRHVSFNGRNIELPCRGILKSYDMLYKNKSPSSSTRRLDSIDSLTCEYNRALSFDNTKSSSYELGSSMDILQREESMDSFKAIGHRFSIYGATDISRCGTSDEDLIAGAPAYRRNTCPNPFQYRPANRVVSRPPGPFKATYIGINPSVRPVVRAGAGGGGRRESGAQTDVSALPPRWSSDGHLSKMAAPPGVSIMPTLPQRERAPVMSRRLTVPDARPPPPVRRSGDLLSDIGFTSMVPELSRSADPVWALGKRGSSVDAEPPAAAASKFLSRGPLCRSGAGVDRSADWTPQHLYPPHKDYRPWRNSLPDVRGDDTDELLQEAESYLRRSIDNLRSTSLDLDQPAVQTGQPYIPSEPRQLRLGHTVKLITPQGRIAVGRVRYVGLAGGTAATSSVVVGAECPLAPHAATRNDGTYRGRRYFLAPPNTTALFVPFRKVVMAWAN